MSFEEIAININLKSHIGINNAFRIARTEGHRFNANLHIMSKTKLKKKEQTSKKCDVTLDKKTRKAHRLLDWQTRELDEPFEINGHKAMYHSNFGIPSLDINYRCAVLQRARCTLDQDKLKTLKEQAKYYGLNKSKDFEDFKNKYLNIKD